MSLIKFNFLSKSLGMRTNVTVMLPTMTHEEMAAGKEDDYKPGVKYQTLFMLHGGSGDDSDWSRFSNIERYAEENKLAVVAPAVNRSFYADMVHGLKYWTYISEELPKVVRSLFPLSEKREDNFVSGFSMGGYGTMSFAIRRPEMFSMAVCMGGVAWKAEKIYEVLKKPERLAFDNIYDAATFAGSEDDVWNTIKKHVENKVELPKFHLAIGSDDPGYAGVVEARDYLRSLGVDVGFEEYAGYAHNWDFTEMYVRKLVYEVLPLKRKAIYPES